MNWQKGIDMHIVTNIGLAVQSSDTIGSVIQHISLEGLKEAYGKIILHIMGIACSGVEWMEDNHLQ